MKKTCIFTALILLNGFIHAQVGINIATPHPSALMEVSALNKMGGLLLPRVALNASTDLVTVPNPAKGLIVYNTINSGAGNTAVKANYIYKFDGNLWKRLTSKEDLQNAADLPSIVAFGRKTTSTGCNGLTSGDFNLNLLSGPISNTGAFIASKNGYYSYSVYIKEVMYSNPGQAFNVSPYISATGLTTLTFNFRGGNSYSVQGASVTGVVYLTAGQSTAGWKWNLGNNTCGASGRIEEQNIVWEYLGNL